MYIPSRRKFLSISCRSLASIGAAGAFSRFGLMNAIAQNRPMPPNFDDGLKCQLVLDAVMQASSSDRWVRVKQMTKSEAI